jgi:hypothetical protein
MRSKEKAGSLATGLRTRASRGTHTSRHESAAAERRDDASHARHRTRARSSRPAKNSERLPCDAGGRTARARARARSVYAPRGVCRTRGRHWQRCSCYCWRTLVDSYCVVRRVSTAVRVTRRRLRCAPPGDDAVVGALGGVNVGARRIRRLPATEARQLSTLACRHARASRPLTSSWTARARTATRAATAGAALGA